MTAGGNWRWPAARRDPPDIVVLDMMLPGIDGIEVCRQLRDFSDAYVIMLTAPQRGARRAHRPVRGSGPQHDQTVPPAGAAGPRSQSASRAVSRGPRG